MPDMRIRSSVIGQWFFGAKLFPTKSKRSWHWKRRIAEANGIASSVRMLGREGFQVMPPKHTAAIAPLARHGLFEAGAMLVGSHALGIVLNKLGVRASALHPGALSEAYEATPKSVRTRLRKAFEAVRESLHPYPAAVEEMDRVLGNVA